MTSEQDSREARKTRLTSDFVEVRGETTWQGKTNGYLKSVTVISKIVDSQNQEVDAVWDRDWKVCAPGIETRKVEETVSHLIGRTRYETRVDCCVRIHRQACPASIQFVATNEYVDYNDSQYSSRDEFVYWIRYVV